MKIAIGCDPNARDYLLRMVKHLESCGHELTDFGSEDPIYANTAIHVGEAVAAHQYDRGILICGTGIGMSIAANKVTGIRAALLSDAYSAQRASLSNDANVACLGAFTLGYRNAELLVDIWIERQFDHNSPSEPKVRAIDCYENRRNHSKNRD